MTSSRATVKRLAKRGHYDSETIHKILDEGLIGHVGIAVDGQPFVIPMLYVRIEECVYLHGSPASRLLQALKDGVQACLTVTLVDGLVLARSAFHHSMNYRSAVLFGKASAVEGAERKMKVLRALSDHVVKGRWDEARGPTPDELRRTLVVEFAIEEASAKIRTGPPLDDEPDYDLPVWAGIVPLSLAAGTPVADPRLKPGIEPPAYARSYRRP
jgi:nitroimidazol reductase NimA-like FMN-containing flavoprotein (pyridoxamine 5'-phosphate oxidase superfamily)